MTHWGLFLILFLMMMGAVLAVTLAGVAVEYLARHDVDPEEAHID